MDRNLIKCCPCPDCSGNTIYECTHKEEWEIALRRAKIGEAWETDSSLEKWFPITAEELARLKAALERIINYPIHSEPVGAAYEMQDIAAKALGRFPV